MPNPQTAVPIRAAMFAEVDGPLLTYCAAFTALSAGVAATSLIASLYGGARVVRVLQIGISGTVAVAAAHFDAVISTYSTVQTVGTPSALTAVPQDPQDVAALATAKFWTAAPTAGTKVGDIASQKLFLPIAGAALNVGAIFNFGIGAGAKAITLRGAGQGCALTFNGATPANATSLDGWVIWTESDQ